MTSLRKQVKDLKIGAPKQHQDYDPEDDLGSKQDASDEETNSEHSGDENAGREHYETVSKSKLRRPEKTVLNDKKYGGQTVSRNSIFRDDNDIDALAPEDDEDDDPFADRTEEATDSGSEGENGTLNDDVLGTGEVDAEVGDDDEIDSDEAFEDGEEAIFRNKGFMFRGSGQDLETLPMAEDEDGDENEDEDMDIDKQQSNILTAEVLDLGMEDIDDSEEAEEDGSITEISEDEEDSDEDESNAQPRPSTFKVTGQTDREKLKALIANDTATLASSLSASLLADAKKGTAVKNQYQTLDRLLDARIKLQKGLTASNDIDLSSSVITDGEAQIALRKAEEAALKLFSTIESIRHSILDNTSSSTVDSNNGQQSRKRKRPSIAVPSTSTSELWRRLETLESHSRPTRRQILDKWASKTRSAAPQSSLASSKLGNTQQHSNDSRSLSTVLTAYLATETSKLPPLSLSQSYSDTQFYQSLLRDLINSRSATATNDNYSTNPLPLKLHPSGNTSKPRSASSKVIDTKASKGRKVRYTVHAKLENFTASEGRGNTGARMGQWTEAAATEFFASLLGQSASALLREEDDDELEEGGGRGEEGRSGKEEEEEALRLFR